jgi:hypothetical protein
MTVTWKKLAYETDVVLKTDYDAYTILRADSDNTPTALVVGASTIVGRKAANGIVALTAAEVRMILNVADGATANAKISAATLETGTDDTGFVTALSIHSAAQHQIPHVAPGASGNILKSDGTDWTSAAIGAPTAHALSAHTVAVGNLLMGGYQAEDQVLQTVANVAAVNAYATPVLGKILWSTAELAAYICTSIA